MVSQASKASQTDNKPMPARRSDAVERSASSAVAWSRRLVPVSFDATIRAIADTMVGEPPVLEHRAEVVEDVSNFLISTCDKMPDYLRLAFHMLTLLFDAWCWPTKGKPFHRLDFAERAAQIASWEQSRLAFRRNLILFFRSFATFGLHSELYDQSLRKGGRNETV